MRNAGDEMDFSHARWGAAAGVVILAIFVTGCASDSSRKTLAGGYDALSQNRLEDAQAAADKVTAAHPTGQGSAEAMYLRGLVFEERARRTDIVQARPLLDEARRCYVRALSLQPTTKLQTSIQAQLANVAYFQDDFNTAIQQGLAASEKLELPVDRAWMLYRVGLSQQRLGQFAKADQTFAAVQQKYAGTDPARRAQTHAGARAFHVRVGTFSNAANAERTIKSLRSLGYVPLQSSDSSGKQTIAVGPVSSYSQAKAMQSALAGQYPDTVIVP